MKKLLIFDGNSIINRAFYAVRPLTNRQGLHTNALFGFANILKKHLDAQKPDYCAIAFDVHAPTFRHKAYDGYKAQRKGMPDELREQMPYAHTLARLFGLAVLEFEGYEADDVLGAASRLAEEAGVESVLVTGDRDALQLVSPMTTVLLCTTGADVPHTPEVIAEKYGVSPEELIEVKALMGDSSDNIPGVRGIGEKGALDLIRRTHSIAALYESLDALSLSPALRKKLEDGREMAELSRSLAEILRTLPGLDDLERLARAPMDREGLAELFVTLEFTKLAAAYSLTSPAKEPQASAPRTPSAPAPAATPAAPTGQLTLDFSAESAPAESPLPADTTVEALASQEALFCLVDEGEFYLEQGGCAYHLNRRDVPSFAARFAPTVFDSKAYFHACLDAGATLESLAVKDDLQLMAYLLDPSGASASLARAATVFLSRLLSMHAPVAERLSLLRALAACLPEELCAEGMTALYRDVELPLAKILCEMERTGILLDRAPLLAYGENLKQKIAECQARIYEAAGGELNLNSPKQLGVLLFETLGLPHAKKTKTGYSTDAETLERLRPLSEVVADVLEYRKLQKLLSTYVEALARQTECTPRVHTTFLQTQTVTGRLSSMDPNLQNIPVKTELGRELRRFFIAEPGWVLLDADYSQVELRILAHLSADEAFLAAFARGEDIHTNTASRIFRVPPEEVTPAMRKDAKAVNFGIVYGIGEYSLSQDLGVSRARAAEYINGYFETYPAVRAYLTETVAEARRTGMVSTLFGRKRRVPELAAANKVTQAFGERVAMNTPIQGTAADIMKIAMVRVRERLAREGRKSRILLQVHDELLLECPVEEKDAVRALLKEEMEAAFDGITLVAEVGEGENWLSAK